MRKSRQWILWGCWLLAIWSMPVARVEGQRPLLGISPGEELIQQTVPARQTSCCLRPGDQLWVISSRELSAPCPTGPLRVWQYEADAYRERSLEDLAASVSLEPSLPTVVYVHGNFTDAGWALQRGCEFYSSLFPPQPCGPAPVRFVIWSWRTEREAGPVVDYDRKVARAVEEGPRLLETLNAAGPDHPLMIGYSLGCQVILSALTVPETAPVRPWQVELIAPALECDFGQRLCSDPPGPARVSGFDVFTNGKDRALKYSRLRCLPGHCGETPFDQYSLPPILRCGAVEVCVREVQSEVGRQHTIKRYRVSPTIVTQIRNRFAQLDPAGETAAMVNPADADPETAATDSVLLPLQTVAESPVAGPDDLPTHSVPHGVGVAPVSSPEDRPPFETGAIAAESADR